MECLFGVTGKDFVLLAADTLCARSIVVMKSNQDKIKDLNRFTAMAYAGESGDAVAFSEYAQKNIKLLSIKNDKDLFPGEAAHFTRRLLADSLRSRDAYQVNLLVGGFNSHSAKPQLFWIDYLASMVAVPFAAHGYGAYFCLSLLDRHFRPEMSENEAIELIKMCFRELKTRFIVNISNYSIKLINANGIREIVLGESWAAEDSAMKQ